MAAPSRKIKYQSTADRLAAAALIATGLGSNSTWPPQQPHIAYNTRTAEEWRELDRQREAKRAQRKARRAARLKLRRKVRRLLRTRYKNSIAPCTAVAKELRVELNAANVAECDHLIAVMNLSP